MPEEAFPRPTRSLSTRVALVSGAGCVGEGIGNGRASAILLAEAGCRVVCVDLSLPLAQRTAEIINSSTPAHGKAIAVQADATKAEDCRRSVETAISEFGRLDILVNVVGVGGAPGTAVNVDMEAWAKSMEINVASMVLMAKFAIPEMEKNVGEFMWRGSIVNIASVAGIRGGNPHLLYPTSKGAIVNMTRAMAVHHAKQGIRVNCVCPGMVYTPMMYAPGMTDEAREARRERSILKTEGTGWDVGAAVRFLAGDEARSDRGGWFDGARGGADQSWVEMRDTLWKEYLSQLFEFIKSQYPSVSDPNSRLYRSNVAMLCKNSHNLRFQ